MNPRECAIVQRLIVDLDDTRLIYATLGPLLIRPHLKFLVERMTESHAAIAEDLVWQMDAIGARTPRRGGGALAKLRAGAESWMAITNVDIELGCLKRIAGHEGRVTRRFHEILENVKGLHQNLHRELCQLERAVFRVDSLMREMNTPSFQATRKPAVAPLQSMHEEPRP